jgi:hypothetical protein
MSNEGKECEMLNFPPPAVSMQLFDNPIPSRRSTGGGVAKEEIFPIHFISLARFLCAQFTCLRCDFSHARVTVERDVKAK